MKKTFLYVFIAVVLGIGIMLFPLWTFFKQNDEPGPIVPTTLKLGSSEFSVPVITPMYASPNWQNYTRAKITSEGEGSSLNYDNGQFQPITGSSIPISLQIAIGFIVAIGAYAVARRRITNSSIGLRYAKG